MLTTNLWVCMDRQWNFLFLTTCISFFGTNLILSSLIEFPGNGTSLLSLVLPKIPASKELPNKSAPVPHFSLEYKLSFNLIFLQNSHLQVTHLSRLFFVIFKPCITFHFMQNTKVKKRTRHKIKLDIKKKRSGVQKRVGLGRFKNKIHKYPSLSIIAHGVQVLHEIAIESIIFM